MKYREFLNRLGAVVTALAVLFLVLCQPASAIIGAPEPIEALLPNHLRAPVGQFLRELGVEDVEAMLSVTKGGDGLGGQYSDPILLRLEHPTMCGGPKQTQRCLTIIGHIKDGVFEALAMFAAGKMMTQGDVIAPFIGKGSRRPPIYLYDSLADDANGVALRETPKGWVVVPLQTNPDAAK